MKIYIKKTSTSNFESLETFDNVLGKGGQARVFKIQSKGYEDFCLKKFIREEDARKNYDRIAYMIQNPPKNIMGSGSFRICWPTAFAYDLQKNFIGYIMPLAFSGSRDLKILEVYNARPISQQAKYQRYPDWFDKYELNTDEGLKNRMKMLCNWAIAIYSLHETHRYVIVDLKPENVMATSSGKISIVDTDSFQISENGKILFPGAAYTPAYFPPEGKNIKQSNVPFPITCDCFAAAVCFYKILTGVHPFGGTIKKVPYDQLETEEEFIKAGLFAYGDKKNYLDFNAAFNLHKHFENLSPLIQTLFKRAFGSDANARPTMDEWGKALYEAATSTSYLIHTTVKPPKTNSLSIQIQQVEFCDTDRNGNVIRNYGSKLYTDVSYLCPKITYKVLRVQSTLEIAYKIYTPSGTLMSNNLSNSNYTNSSLISCYLGNILTEELSGWGNDNKMVYTEPGTWKIEFYEGDKCLYKTSIEIHALTKTTTHHVTPPIPPKAPQTPPPAHTKKGKSHGCLWFLFLIGALWAGYQFWYKDYKRDKDAPRSYVYATNLFLRSSAIADVEYNRITTIPYGSELITYSNENGWAYVKANGEKGYVASDFLLNAQEFHLLNGIWGNEDAKEAVPTAKCRLAMLNYLKDNGMKTGNSAWQLYAKPKEIKPNSVLFPRLNDGYDNFTEFAFILKDNQTGNRKLALYCFEEDETPVFRYTEDAPTKGDIKSITYSKWNNKYKVVYSNQEFTYTPKAKDEPVKEPLNVVSNKLTVLAAVFADTDYDRNILTGYGQQLYSDMQYLTGKVSYRKQFATQETVTLQVKIIRPNGTIDRGNTSPAEYSFEQKVTISEKEGVFEMLGWGSTSRKSYPPGTYHYEIWMDGTKLYSQAIDIEEKAEENIVIPDDMVFEVAEQMPEFPNGGMVGVMQYLGKNIKYPATAQENGIQGRVTVQFVVNKDGSITDVKIVKGIDPNLDKEAMRVVANMPKWKPGKIGGKPVRVKYAIPVNFRLN